jgi:phosphatidate cytidylyltransferase
MTDTGAYFTGKKFGKSKLAPHISPKKTIEGALGGMVFSLLTSLCFFFISDLFSLSMQISFMESFVLGILVGVIGQIGDLIESLLKRDGGIKDSNQLPGLGGILDVVDSLIFTTPLIYFFLRIFSKSS